MDWHRTLNLSLETKGCLVACGLDFSLYWVQLFPCISLGSDFRKWVTRCPGSTVLVVDLLNPCHCSLALPSGGGLGGRGRKRKADLFVLWSSCGEQAVGSKDNLILH